MTKKKWVYLLVIILLAGFVLFIYNAFNGNPLSKITAKSNLQSYLEKTYPEDKFVIQSQFYNFKNSGYDFQVIRIGEEEQTEYEFIVTGFFGSNIQSDGIYYANLDEQLIHKLQQEASTELKVFLQKQVPEVLEVSPILEVLKGKYPDNATWSKEFKPEVPMYLHIPVDASEFSKEDILQASILIQKSLNEANYQYDHVTINGNIVDENYEEEKDKPFWIVKFALGFDSNTKLTLKDIEEVQ